MGDRALNDSDTFSPKRIFDEAFPLYLAMGMTYELYWDGRPELAVSYRKADQIRQKQRNNDAWLQGVYFRMAVASTLDKKAKYPKEPFRIGESEPNPDTGMTIQQEKAKAAMLLFAERFNTKMHSDATQRGDMVEYTD